MSDNEKKKAHHKKLKINKIKNDDDRSTDSDDDGSDLADFIVNDEDEDSQIRGDPSLNPAKLWTSRGRRSHSPSRKRTSRSRSPSGVQYHDYSSSESSCCESYYSSDGVYEPRSYDEESSSEEDLSDLGPDKLLPPLPGTKPRKKNRLVLKKDGKLHHRKHGNHQTQYHTDGRPICWYDEKCFRTNPKHYLEFAHPKKEEALLQESINSQPHSPAIPDDLQDFTTEKNNEKIKDFRETKVNYEKPTKLNEETTIKERKENKVKTDFKHNEMKIYKTEKESKVEKEIHDDGKEEKARYEPKEETRYDNGKSDNQSKTTEEDGSSRSGSLTSFHSSFLHDTKFGAVVQAESSSAFNDSQSGEDEMMFAAVKKQKQESKNTSVESGDKEENIQATANIPHEGNEAQSEPTSSLNKELPIPSEKPVEYQPSFLDC
ncbi:uncharacterized protein MONOS_2032 [Monocercomonoides exilis]|uniref:uncharacterized protein n=1 Tax=Monocercomonoides exilis TaxID=2049356 RepID=UPI003559840A|nr:hypothetical protein MONOS_2032 [Monocercomonoides exilis]|eukprot:MONOS_2032.1-p1 / transcript=MONOS_2032.1 / gene=MONOS_2032 / organism=Monocercomonoides_exilis_PA203 / gene_product=unspecified product / transcript_product=unspecified product / location=Mono_scaffold00039:123688-124980(+) / protein_length=430 / sequence_SO=supercontig / SO=protein_coding / is_pseudo=false